MRILVTGASGSGTTTLGSALAAALGATHLDLDDCYWLRTEPPYQQKRDAAQRLALCLQHLRAPALVASGSLVGWGAELEDAFDLIVFLTLPAATRVERLRAREILRHGRADPAFLTWAAQYDEGPPEGRSRAKHEAWLAGRSCPVLRLDGDQRVAERLRRVLDALGR